MSALDDLWIAVAQVPAGTVVSYGDLGMSLPSPVSGVLVGKWMAQCPDDLPWWRVVGKSGDLLVARRDPRLAAIQRQRLISEGVEFEGDLVKQTFFQVP